MGEGNSYFARVERLASPEAVMELLTREAATFGYRAVAIGAPPTGNSFAPFFYSTWPVDWISTYLAEGLAGDDPIPEAVKRLRRPFTWAELVDGRVGMRLTPEQARVPTVAAMHGWLGGFVVPVHGPGGYVAAASFAGDRATLSPQDRAAVRALALAGHDRLWELHVRERRQTAGLLTRREAEALGWVLAGLGDAAIAERMGISARTVRFHVDNARLKLHCSTRSQAAGAALRLGLLNL